MDELRADRNDSADGDPENRRHRCVGVEGFDGGDAGRHGPARSALDLLELRCPTCGAGLSARSSLRQASPAVWPASRVLWIAR